MSAAAIAQDAPRPPSSATRGRYVMAIILFRLVLDVCYISYVVPAFQDYYLRPMVLDFDFAKYILSFIFLVPLAFLPFRKDDFSSIFFLSATMFLYLPATTIFGLDQSAPLTGMIAIVVAMGVCYLFIKSPFLRIGAPLNVDGEKAVLVLAFGFCLLFLAYSFVTGAAENISFDLGAIYLNRETQGTLLERGIMAYLGLWTQKVFSPFILLIGIYRKNWYLIGFSLVMQVLFFGITQHRIHLVLPLLIFLVSRLYASRITLPTLIMWSAGILLAVLGASLYFDLTNLPAIFLRRAFFVPPMITFDWVSLFLTEPKMYWSDRLLAWLLDTRYNGIDTTWYIGWLITGDDDVAYNSGIVGAGFANAGYFGVVFYAAVLGMAVQVVNGMVERGLPIFIPAALLFGSFRTAWADADLFSAMLSHGILAGIFVLWLYGARRKGARDAAAPTTGAPQPISKAT